MDHRHLRPGGDHRGACDEVPGDAPTGTDPHPPSRAFRLLLAIAAVILAIDAITKALVVALLQPGFSVPMLGATIMCTDLRQTAPGWLTDARHTWMLTLTTVAVAAAILCWGRRLQSWWWAAGLGTLLGGTLGNLADRLFRAPGPLRGAIIDFIEINGLPIFNLADVAVVGSAVMLIALSLTAETPHSGVPEHQPPPHHRRTRNPPNTNHVSAILTKLGVHNRTQAPAAYAVNGQSPQASRHQSE